MKRKNNIVYVITHMGPASMILTEKILAGIEDAAAKHRMSIRYINDTAHIGVKSKTAIIIGVKKAWVQNTIQQLQLLGIKPVLAGAERSDFGENISGAGFARQTLVEELVKYFFYAGRRRLASVGHESADVNDIKRIQAFKNMAHSLGLSISDDDFYTLDGGSQNCIHRFLEQAGRYDGAICVNDYVALQLVEAAKEQGIAVPEQLFVAGSGNMLLGRCMVPSLTTTTLDYYNIGMQSVNICKMLSQDASVDTVSIMVPSKLICRASTGYETPSPSVALYSPLPAAHARQEAPDDPMRLLKNLEICLQQCDELDYKILDGILKNFSIDQLAYGVFVSPGTVHYRLKKLYQAAGVTSKRELIMRAKPYLQNIKGVLYQSEER